MPYCPKCRVEYREGFSVCADCDEKLVAILPPEESDEEPGDDNDENEKYQDWVPLSRLENPQYAEMIEGRLEELNIPVVILSKVRGHEMARLVGVPTPFHFGGGYTIAVPREFAETADLEGEAILGEDWIKGKSKDSSY
jgi:hypothetical protein